MKYIVLIIAAFAWACDNQTARYQSLADDLFGPDEDSLLAEESPDTDTEGDKWWEDAPNTLPDTTVATCGNGIVDEGEECDYMSVVQRFAYDRCRNIDPDLYGAGEYDPVADCNNKWCRWDLFTCKQGVKFFDCPKGYAGEDCKKCAPEYQDYDGDGYCYGSCADDIAFINHITGIFTVCGEHGSCEYYEGKPVCSCDEGWTRDEIGSCSISE